MEVDHCFFPDDLLYSPDDNVWLRLVAGDYILIGVTSVLTGISGRLVRATLKPVNARVEPGQSIGTLESEKFVGPIRSPISGILVEQNPRVLANPKIINDSCYDNGWIARISPIQWKQDKTALSSAADSRTTFAKAISEHHVRCFKAFPDREVYEIGTECNAVITRLNEQIASMPLGEVIHLVSDDPTAYVEMVAWTDRTGQELVDWRKEGVLFHFIIRKNPVGKKSPPRSAGEEVSALGGD